MREIKFRIWDEAERQMMSWEEVDERDKTGVYQFLDMIEEDGFEVMQYTGLKDIDSRDIYEGDICEAEQMLYPLTGTRTGVVKYLDGSYLLEDLNGLDGDFLFSETAETRIIGNIYENPELLEVTP